MVGMEDPSLLHQQQTFRTGIEGGAPAKRIHEAGIAGPKWNGVKGIRKCKRMFLSESGLLLSQTVEGAEAPDQFAAIDPDDAAIWKTFF